ncbi:hypothetical protein FISHEDRAFT_41474 [Fistulina hepatica ATCC 64428]|nr:hypothetical protein FISHEDRAFT_41474 [Fistulina hepatica ATCC 64428]
MEYRIARISDPAVDLDTKLQVAIEIRRLFDDIQDADTQKHMPSVALPVSNLMRSVPISSDRESTEYQLRRILLEILARLPVSDTVRANLPSILTCMLTIVRDDCEDNGVSACKIIMDLVRSYRFLNDDILNDFCSLFHESQKHVPTLVSQLLAESSPVIAPGTVIPGVRSFKVLSEMGLVLVIFCQFYRPQISPKIQQCMNPAYEILSTQSPAQKKSREDYEKTGNIWAGMSPNIKNVNAYSEFLTCQAKILSFLTFISRWSSDVSESHGEILILACVRILQDMPSNSIALRKDVMVVLRHLLSTPSRRAIIPYLDKILDERVILGTTISSKEILRHSTYLAVSDFLYHVRAELNLEQIRRIIQVYAPLIHEPSFFTNVPVLLLRLLINLTEPLTAMGKEAPDNPEPRELLMMILETCVDRLQGLTTSCGLNGDTDKLPAPIPSSQGASGAKTAVEVAATAPVLQAAQIIELARPVGGAHYAIDKHDDVVSDSRLMFRALLQAIRASLQGLRKLAYEPVDGTIFIRMFDSCIRCSALFDPIPRLHEGNGTDVSEFIGPVLVELSNCRLQEVWSIKIEFFFEFAQKRMMLLQLCHYMFSRETTSPTLLAIVLKFLVDRLPLLGDLDDLTAAATIRLYKMAFGAVALHPTHNEAILASHLSKLLMDCFPLATKAVKPMHYYLLLKALFRAIGGGGGRFELLYKEVLPLLPEMLENLNRQLQASEGVAREMIVELCLTVPLRLTHLLPHLTYLMQPLALALRGSPDLVAQGLRTLELCIDNLTPDFLDPNLNLVLRDLMEALHSHLKPLPDLTHFAAHVAIRILGKLGGRNRRLLMKDPLFEYRNPAEDSKMPLSWNGQMANLPLGSAVRFAVRALSVAPNRLDVSDRDCAYDFIESTTAMTISEGITTESMQSTFSTLLKGVADATHIPALQDRAIEFFRNVARTVFAAEILYRRDLDTKYREVRGEGTSSHGSLLPRSSPNAMMAAFLDAVPDVMARDKPEQAKAAADIIGSIIHALVSSMEIHDIRPVFPHDVLPILHHFTVRFTAMALEDPWPNKQACYFGIKIMMSTPGPMRDKWVSDRDTDLLRALMHILRETPPEVGRDVRPIMDLLLDVLRVTTSNLIFTGEGATTGMPKVLQLLAFFIMDIQASNVLVRDATHQVIAFLVKLSGKTAHELLMHHRERITNAIYTKPLRALPFSLQIGMIEAVRYCISLEPSLLELSEEFLRLLHEALALADAEDNALLGRASHRQGSIDIIRLRVACIKLLTAAMPLTDFFSRQAQTRQRVTSVYFKSLYSPSQEVKNVAHEGLKMVLTHQSRLPKELLQTGLRPILMNLADPKRLSVPGLEGLARLLELLTNYFKVEIGHKLLDHFRIVADPQTLEAASRTCLPLDENITKLVRLANIFHLLPSSAHIFLENLANAIIQVESSMLFSGRSPFSEPLAKYLNRYPVEGVNFFLRHLHFPKNLRTFRSIIQAHLAPALERELACQTPYLVDHIRGSKDPSPLLIPSLSLFLDLVQSEQGSSWLGMNEDVIHFLREIWHSEAFGLRQATPMTSTAVHRISLIRDIMIRALEYNPRVDLLFDLPLLYAVNLGVDTIDLTHFLYKHVALCADLIFKRNVLMRFVTWFADPSVPWVAKGPLTRYVITPTLLVHAKRHPDAKAHLIDSGFVRRLARDMWLPVADANAYAEMDDSFHIECLHLTTILVQYYSYALEDVKKDIIRYAWHIIMTRDDNIVKQTGYLLTAHFFVAFSSPEKFILRTWQGLIRLPNTDLRSSIRFEAIATMAPCLPSSEEGREYPQWAVTTRRLAVEEGVSQLATIFHLIIRQPDLFYPVRALFVANIANSLVKLGLSTTSNVETRLLSLEILQVVSQWEQRASRERSIGNEGVWSAPLPLRESLVSYLVRLMSVPHDLPARNTLLPKALELLKTMATPTSGMTGVTFGLRFFSKTLEQSDFSSEVALPQVLTAAKILLVIASEQSDSWFETNFEILSKLVRKGLECDNHDIQDALSPIFSRLIRLYLPVEGREMSSETANFHSWMLVAVADGLRVPTPKRGSILMLRAICQTDPETFEDFTQPLFKVLHKMSKDHTEVSIVAPNYEHHAKLLIMAFEIVQDAVAIIGAEHRRHLVTLLGLVAEKSKYSPMLMFLLELARSWAASQAVFPSVKEKSAVLSKMIALESKGDTFFQPYLQLIYDIYENPNYRRSELTTRLENSFLVGCRTSNSPIRQRFIELFDASVARSLMNRLVYIFGVQNWEILADTNWIYLAIHLVLGASDADLSQQRTLVFGQSQLTRPKAEAVIKPLERILFFDAQTAHEVWVALFPAAWSCLSRREQSEVTLHLINFLSKEYHTKQSRLRPNIVQTVLEGVHACSPPMTLPPHLVKYLAKTFGAWHVSLEILGSHVEVWKQDDPSTREYVYDSLADVYAELAEDDFFYGVWRRRCLHKETNNAIAFEQNGMWEQAQLTYESAQNRTRSGQLPFTEAEYCLWEDHWIMAAEKLQQWDLLYELASGEGNTELLLESAWRTRNWSEKVDELEGHIQKLPDIATPRRRVFEAFIALLKSPDAIDKNTEFTTLLEDAMQLTLRKWGCLPTYLSAAHIPLLRHFQQFVELQEAVQIFGSLSATTAQNLERKSSELKMVLQAWRERLPNIHDDIDIWSDLVAWRQNVFHAINHTYIPLIPPPNQNSGATASSNTFGYRGYHETAWIINRFAHVARKHDLLDVCFTYLNKIYTLPNIEISEAFLKLREQARCHYQKPNDLQAGLDVINNTNLVFFTASQKAEFYTLKGMFHAKLGRNEDANGAFGSAIQLDMQQPKAWAQWGKYSDHMFKDNPSEIAQAVSAVTCYLQAAGLYKNSKSRPLLARVLWLLSLDDAAQTIGRAFDTYKGDIVPWYWIPLIPQLCQAFAQREMKQVRYVLHAIARAFPQAIFYHLRTSREEMLQFKRILAARAQQMAKEAAEGAANDNSGQQPGSSSADAQHASSANSITDLFPRQAWDYLEELTQMLKTAFPLLALSMETLVDQMLSKLKLTIEEDTYRNTSLLLNDAYASYSVRANSPDDDGAMLQSTLQNISRVLTQLAEPIRKDFEQDFLSKKMTHPEYIVKMQQWRDRYEKLLSARPRVQALDALSPYLVQYQYSKVDEIEVPGQYTEDRDGNNQAFVRIQKFGPKFENCKPTSLGNRRFVIIGHDNSRTTFTTQYPYQRHYRREERTHQLARTLNGALMRKKESQKRNLSFHIPVTVSLSINLRLSQTDGSYVSFQDILEDFCASRGIAREDPILYIGRKMKKALREVKWSSRGAPNKQEYFLLKKELIDEVRQKMITSDLIYMIRTMANPQELWRIRKQFILQVAAASFLTYMLGMTGRHPPRFYISRSTGLVFMNEMIAGMSQQQPLCVGGEHVPFRLTPNMQEFIGSVGIEGPLTAGLMAIGRSLTEPKYDLEQHLCLFVRDEVAHWMTVRAKVWQNEPTSQTFMATNIDQFIKRAESVACKTERDLIFQNSGNQLSSPVIHSISSLINQAVNPLQHAKAGEAFAPWF